MCKLKDDGGLNMINVVDMHNSFMMSWAIGLQNSTDNYWSVTPRYVFSSLDYGLSCFDSNASSKKLVGVVNCRSVFWRQVLLTWLDNKHILYEKYDATPVPLMNQCI
eukprot:GHVL01029983.1.p2 GENE.GHVL01029983.1~~GHVL01029983.1.p2  ORF type:complete len:107 (-),score=13.38 GHVL01029983.1:701-1021(-)